MGLLKKLKSINRKGHKDLRKVRKDFNPNVLPLRALRNP
jgi:hypothetical protein